MYSDRLVRRKGWLLWAALLVLTAILILMAFGGNDRSVDNGSEQAIRTAVQRGALQCYVVEGVYPPDLEYLEDNYGLQVNREDYYITYDAFASNLPPTVRVTRK